MVETSTKIRNKQKQIWRKILMFQLSCSDWNLVLPLAVMQNINIMCMCVTAQAFVHAQSKYYICLWYSGYNSWIYCHDRKVPYPVYFPVMFWQLPTAMHWLTAEYRLLWLPSKMFNFHCSQSTYTHLQQIMLCYIKYLKYEIRNILQFTSAKKCVTWIKSLV